MSVCTGWPPGQTLSCSIVGCALNVFGYQLSLCLLSGFPVVNCLEILFSPSRADQRRLEHQAGQFYTKQIGPSFFAVRILWKHGFFAWRKLSGTTPPLLRNLCPTYRGRLSTLLHPTY